MKRECLFSAFSLILLGCGPRGFADGVDDPPDDPPVLEADLRFFNLGSPYSPQYVSAGETLRVDFLIKNQGTADSGGFFVEFYLSTNPTITPSDYLLGTEYVSSIPPDGLGRPIADYTVPALSIGTYYFGWMIDSSDVVQESNESNNIGCDGDLLHIQ